MISIKKKIAIIFSTLLVGAYIAGIVIQYVKPDVRQVSAGDAWNVINVPVTFNIFKCIIYCFSDTIGLLILALIMLVLITIGFFSFFSKDKAKSQDERNFTISEKGTYGTADWLSDDEAKEVLDFKPIEETTGTILGRKNGLVISFPEKSRLNRHIATFGASGTGKSRGFSINHIIQCALRGESIIATDPKGELFKEMAPYLRSKGFEVHVFDLVDPEYSDSWACLHEIISEPKKADLMAQTFCNVIIMNTGGKTGGDFWDNAELNLLKALSLYVVLDENRSEEQRSIGAVYQIIVDNDETKLDALFDRLPRSHPAIQPYGIFKKAGKIAGNIMVGLGNRLSAFQNDIIKKITSFPEIDLEQPAKEKTAIFVIMSDQDSTFDFLSSLFFSFLFIRCVRYADVHGKGGKCDVPVNFILDEFTNIGQIPDFTKKLSTIRSRDLRVSMIFQNIPQLQNRYPDGLWEEILGNCDTQLFLGCTDQTTAEYISERSGEMTIDVVTDRIEKQAIALTQTIGQYGESTTNGKRYLMTKDEVMRFPNDECLIMMRGKNIYRANKFDYSNHPEAKKLKPESIKDYVPQWKANTEAKDSESEDEYDEMFGNSNKEGAKENSADETTAPETPSYEDKKAEEQIKAQKIIEQAKEGEKSSSTTISDDDGLDEFFG